MRAAGKQRIQVVLGPAPVRVLHEVLIDAPHGGVVVLEEARVALGVRVRDLHAVVHI